MWILLCYLGLGLVVSASGQNDGSCSRTYLEGNARKVNGSNSDGCFDKEFRDLLNMVNNLKGDALSQTVVAEVASILSDLTNKSEGLSQGNLNASIIIINKLTDLLRDSNITLNGTEIESIIQAISNVLQTNNTESWKKLNDVDKTIATVIFSITDDFGLRLATLNIPGYVTVSTDNLVLEALSIERSKLPLQIEFPNGWNWGENHPDEISISMETLNGSISSESQPTLNMWGVYYRTIHDYLPGKNNTGVVNSRVLSFSIVGQKVNDTLSVRITLQHNQDKRRGYRKKHCAFWNFNIGDWDSAGCNVTSTNWTRTICSCDHLTNFAVLKSTTLWEDNEYNEYKLLPLIATVGCSISVAALIATIIVYASTWKQAKSAQAAVLLNLCVALIVAYTIFLTGTDTIQSVIGCKVFHVMLHYFYLAAFFFMLAEGVELLLYTVFVFHVRTTRETIMLVAAAWVLPLIIVTVSQLSHGSNNGNGYSIGFGCWVSFVQSHIFALIGPILFVIGANFVILIIVLIWICKKRTCLASNAKKRNEIRAMLWNLSVAGPVLGLGWLVTSVLLLSIGHVVLFYLFIIINSSQGSFIFIFHALLHNKTVKEKISSIYQKYICSCHKTFEEPPKKKEKSDLPPMVFRDNKGIEIQGSGLSSGTHTASIDNSGTVETTH